MHLCNFLQRRPQIACNSFEAGIGVSCLDCARDVTLCKEHLLNSRTEHWHLLRLNQYGTNRHAVDPSGTSSPNALDHCSLSGRNQRNNSGHCYLWCRTTLFSGNRWKNEVCRILHYCMIITLKTSINNTTILAV